MTVEFRPFLKWLGKEVAHILLTFMVGVAIATAYHELVTSRAVRSAAERVCVIYGRDEQECKNGIDTVLNMSDEEVQNNIEIHSVVMKREDFGTVRVVEKGE